MSYRKVELAGTAYQWQILDRKRARGEPYEILTHIAEMGPDGYEPVRVLCPVKIASVLPDRSLYDEPGVATCQRCLAAYRRIQRAASKESLKWMLYYDRQEQQLLATLARAEQKLIGRVQSNRERVRGLVEVEELLAKYSAGGTP